MAGPHRLEALVSAENPDPLFTLGGFAVRAACVLWGRLLRVLCALCDAGHQVVQLVVRLFPFEAESFDLSRRFLHLGDGPSKSANVVYQIPDFAFETPISGFFNTNP